jgi:ribosome-associated protein
MSKPLAGKKLVDAIVASAKEKLAEKITVVDLRGLGTTSADYFVVCQSETSVQNQAIANAIFNECAEKNSRPWHTEGEGDGRWILMDFSDVVVHVMLDKLRAFYSLETIWPEAKVTEIAAESAEEKPAKRSRRKR